MASVLLPKALLFRGVHAGHPAYEAALRGEVRPGDIAGVVTPREHTRGSVSASSPFTSWTRDRELAIWFAGLRGPGGLLLTAAIGPPGPNESWIWEYSTDGWYEDEVLLRGVRIGVGVTQL